MFMILYWIFFKSILCVLFVNQLKMPGIYFSLFLLLSFLYFTKEKNVTIAFYWIFKKNFVVGIYWPNIHTHRTQLTINEMNLMLMKSNSVILLYGWMECNNVWVNWTKFTQFLMSIFSEKAKSYDQSPLLIMLNGNWMVNVQRTFYTKKHIDIFNISNIPMLIFSPTTNKQTTTMLTK